MSVTKLFLKSGNACLSATKKSGNLFLIADVAYVSAVSQWKVIHVVNGYG